MSQYFPPYKSFERNIKLELDPSNYVTKTDFSSFASKTNLASLKTKVNKLDINKLTPAPNDLAKLSNVVKMMLSKRLYMTSWLLK